MAHDRLGRVGHAVGGGVESDVLHMLPDSLRHADGLPKALLAAARDHLVLRRTAYMYRGYSMDGVDVGALSLRDHDLEKCRVGPCHVRSPLDGRAGLVLEVRFALSL